VTRENVVKLGGERKEEEKGKRKEVNGGERVGVRLCSFFPSTTMTRRGRGEKKGERKRGKGGWILYDLFTILHCFHKKKGKQWNKRSVPFPALFLFA